MLHGAVFCGHCTALVQIKLLQKRVLRCRQQYSIIRQCMAWQLVLLSTSGTLEEEKKGAGGASSCPVMSTREPLFVSAVTNLELGNP